jgi:YggT family protein
MEIVCILFTVYYVILLARIILSWATMVWSPPPSVAPAVRIIYDLTEPVMGLFRRLIPPMGGLDLSPIFVFLLLAFAQRAIGC